MYRTCTHACGNTAEDECVRICRLLKRESSQIIYERFANVQFKYRSRKLWCRGYYMDTVGKNTKKTAEYIQNQLKEDQIAQQLELEFEDPFTGKKN